MDWAQGQRALEAAVDAAAAAIFAAAAAFAAEALSRDRSAALLAVAVPAFLLALAMLRSVPPEERRYALPEFALVVEPAEAGTQSHDQLLLTDVLPAAEPGARVVQLFGPAGAAAAAGGSLSTPADASEALSKALAALRRSLH